jgi:hypothetical protein
MYEFSRSQHHFRNAPIGLKFPTLLREASLCLLRLLKSMVCERRGVLPDCQFRCGGFVPQPEIFG